MTRIPSRPAALALAVLAGLTTAACSDDPVAPAGASMAVVAGAYDVAEAFGALTFTTTSGGATTDWLEAGARLTLNLDPDGAVSGRLFIPGADEDGSDMDEDMAGSWILEGSTVHLEQDADTFLRDMPFIYDNGVLSGERTFDDVRVTVVLVRR